MLFSCGPRGRLRPPRNVFSRFAVSPAISQACVIRGEGALGGDELKHHRKTCNGPIVAM